MDGQTSFGRTTLSVGLGCLVVGALFATVPATVGASTLDGMNGDGTEEDPYVITNATELQAMNEELSANYTLGNDVDASDTAGWNDGKGFEPVGNSSDPFAGSFDGAGFAVTNLTIDRPAENDVGLFGVVDGGSIANVSLVDANVSGSERVGGLVGTTEDGSIVDSSVDATVNGSTNVGGFVGLASGSDPLLSNVSGSVVVTTERDGQSYGGGVVGKMRAEGVVVDAAMTVDVSVTSTSANTFVGVSAGGLIGNADFTDVSNASVTGTVSATIPHGDSDVGGLVGDGSDGQISNSTAGVTIEGDGGNYANVGGLVGSIYDVNVTDSHASGTVDGNSTGDGVETLYAGGLVGWTGGDFPLTIERSYATANVSADAGQEGYAGGLVGETGWSDATTTVTDSFATGSVEANAGTDVAVGGAFGRLHTDSSVTVTGVYSLGDVQANAGGTAHVGGLVGQNDSVSVADAYWNLDRTPGLTDDDGVGSGSDGGVAGLTTTEMTGLAATVTMDGFDFYETWMPSTSHPELAWKSDFEDETDALDELLDGDGTEADPYVITNVYELQSMNANRAANYVLGYDVDASDTESWNDGEGFEPVGERFDGFTGSFDGDGHAITGLFVDRPTSGKVGLFGESQGHVSNLELVDVNVTGSRTVGGLVGEQTSAPISNVSVSGTVAGSDQYVGGIVGWSGDVVRESTADVVVTATASDVGGLVGRNAGEIHTSSASGDVTGSDGEENVGGLAGHNDGEVHNASANGSVGGYRHVGGLVGNNEGAIHNSSASGDVTGTDYGIGGLVGYGGATVHASHATGSVHGDRGVGGLVGWSYDEVADSYATGDVTGNESVGGLVGITNLYSLDSSYATGAVTGDEHVGGLIGRNGASVADSYATGNVSGNESVGGLVGTNVGDDFGWFDPGTVNASVAVGAVTSDGDDVGGLVGNNTANGETGDVIDAYWDVDATGLGDSAGPNATGLTTAEMTGPSAIEHTNLSFDDPWLATDGYPLLAWQITNLDLALGSTSIDEGDTTRATVTLSLDGGTTESATTTADYASSDGGVATMDADGVLTGEGGGSATITASLGEHDDSVDVDVEAAPSSPPPSRSSPDDDEPNISIRDVRVDATAVEVGEDVTASARVENDGNADGSVDLALTVDGQEVRTETVAVPAGTNRTVSFATSFEEPGTYELAIDGTVAGTVVVDEPADEPEEEATTEPTPEPDEQTDDDTRDDGTSGDGTPDDGTSTETPEQGIDEAADTPTETTSEGQPGFGTLAAIVALVAAVVRGRLRRD